MAEMPAVRFRVTGRVQGVGFRFFVIREARRLGLSGWARNLPDGSVEVVADGDPGAIENLAARLRDGPPAARVDAVEREPMSHDAVGEGFEVRH